MTSAFVGLLGAYFICPGMSGACGTVPVTWPTFEMSMVINLHVSG